METQEEVKKAFKLPQEKVIVRLVDKPRGAITDKDHIGFNMYPGSTFQLCPRNKRGSTTIDCPLTPEEIEFFENKRLSGMSFDEGELSPHAPDKDNYWRSKRAVVTLTNRPLHLDLSKAGDYLKYAIIKSNSDLIAPSAADEFKKKSYVFVITSDKEIQTETIKAGDIQKRAWKIAAKMEDDIEKMIDYLTVIGKRPSANADRGFLISEIDKQVQTNIKDFLEILEDPQFETRTLIAKSLQIKSVTKEGHKYFLSSGDPLCNKGEINNLQSALNFLDAPENQDIKLTLEARLNNRS